MDEVRGYLVKVEAKILHLLQDLVSLFYCLFLVEKNCVMMITVLRIFLQQFVMVPAYEILHCIFVTNFFRRNKIIFQVTKCSALFKLMIGESQVFQHTRMPSFNHCCDN